MKPILKITLVTMLTAGLFASPALARDHGHDRDDARAEHHDRDRDHDRDHKSSEHRRSHHFDRDRHDRDDHDFRADRGTPPGWSHGRKKGWGDCDAPPGQAKKHGCDGDRDDYARDDRDHHYREGQIRPAPRPVPVRGGPVVHRPTDVRTTSPRPVTSKKTGIKRPTDLLHTRPASEQR